MAQGSARWAAATAASPGLGGVAAAGGLIFGWNALALTLKAQGNYNAGCGDATPGAPSA